MKRLTLLSVATALSFSASVQAADELRLLTWGGYAPQAVVDMFEKETGIKVKVTKSNNEEMISKLKATRGAGFDLAQPSQDRVSSAQKAHNIYKPLDLSKIDNTLFISSMLEATKGQSMLAGDIYAVPHVWGSSGLIVNSAEAAGIQDYTDLCKPAYAGKVTYRLKRPTLIAFAFSMGEDPFAAYSDKDKYQQIMTKVGQKLSDCKANVKAYWSGGDAMLNLMRSGETTAAMAWDAG
ncbi:extracellular solute-binding protein, partial [Marinomonas sp.]